MTSGSADPRELVLTTRRQEAGALNDDETAKVLNQADALMRRHRVFVADTQTAETPVTTQNTDDDLPVLTDAVDHRIASEKSPHLSSDSIGALRQLAISSVINQWLEEALPLAIQEVSDEMSDRLVAKLSAKARAELTERLIRELDKPLS